MELGFHVSLFLNHIPNLYTHTYQWNSCFLLSSPSTTHQIQSISHVILPLYFIALHLNYCHLVSHSLFLPFSPCSNLSFLLQCLSAFLSTDYSHTSTVTSCVCGSSLYCHIYKAFWNNKYSNLSITPIAPKVYYEDHVC